MKTLLKNVIDGIKNFIKGFKKINYEVPLKENAEISMDTILRMGSTIAHVTQMIGYYPIIDVTYGISNYKITKVNNTKIYDKVQNGEQVSFTKVSTEFFKSSNRKEIRVTNQAFFIGLDNELWRIDVNCYFIYTCWNNVFDTQIIDLSIDYTNGFILAMGINAMSKTKIEVKSIYEQDNIHTRNFSGYVKTFGDNEIYEVSNMNSLLPDNLTNDAKFYSDALCEEIKFEDLLRENSLVIDVIRKTKRNIAMM